MLYSLVLVSWIACLVASLHTHHICCTLRKGCWMTPWKTNDDEELQRLTDGLRYATMLLFTVTTVSALAWLSVLSKPQG